MCKRVIVPVLIAVGVWTCLSVVGAAGASGDSREKELWDSAWLTNTLEAADAYLAEFPDGKHAGRLKVHRHELVQDLAHREQDKATVEAVLEGACREPKLPASEMGETFNLWKRVAYDRGRVQFEDAPGFQVEAVAIGLALRDWPPGLSGSKNFGYVRCKGEIFISPTCLARILDGEGFIQPFSIAPGGQELPITSVMPPMGPGSVHIFKGKKLRVFGLEFSGDAEDPLRFVVGLDGGYTYLGGSGSVNDATGRIIFSSPNASREAAPHPLEKGS